MSDSTTILNKLMKHMLEREADPLQPLVDEYYQIREKKDRRLRGHWLDMDDRLRPGGRFSPSSMCGCMRQAAFRYLGVPGSSRINPEREMLMDDGKWRHLKWQAIFRDMQMVLGKKTFKVISTEGPIAIPELYIAGNSDAVVKIEGVKWVIDIKGANSRSWSWTHDNEAPDPRYVRQLITYCKGHDIPRGLLWYDNKDNQQTRGYVVNLEDHLWQEVAEWVEEVILFMEEREVPPMAVDCERGNFMYNKCPYAYLCYGNKTEVQIRRKAYRRFESIEAAWEAGHEAIEAHNSK